MLLIKNTEYYLYIIVLKLLKLLKLFLEFSISFIKVS